MKNMLHRRVAVALVLALTASCASTRLGADGVVKAPLGSLRRNDMVVVDVRDVLDTNAVYGVVSEYDQTVIQPREADKAVATNVVNGLIEAYDQTVIQPREADKAAGTNVVNDLIGEYDRTVIQPRHQDVLGEVSKLEARADGLVEKTDDIYDSLEEQTADVVAWLVELDQWQHNVSYALGFGFEYSFLDTNTVFSVFAGDIGLRPRQAVSVMGDARVFMYGVGGYGGLDPTNGVRDLATVVNAKADRSEIPTKAEDIGALPDTYVPPSAPVASVNGQTGTVVLAASDIRYSPTSTVEQAIGALKEWVEDKGYATTTDFNYRIVDPDYRSTAGVLPKGVTLKDDSGVVHQFGIFPPAQGIITARIASSGLIIAIWPADRDGDGGVYYNEELGFRFYDGEKPYQRPPDLLLYRSYILTDRAVNRISRTAATEISTVFPDIVPGRSRDFYVRLELAAGVTNAPVFTRPADIILDLPEDGFPIIATSADKTAVTILHFIETSPSAFTVSAVGSTVSEVHPDGRTNVVTTVEDVNGEATAITVGMPRVVDPEAEIDTGVINMETGLPLTVRPSVGPYSIAVTADLAYDAHEAAVASGVGSVAGWRGVATNRFSVAWGLGATAFGVGSRAYGQDTGAIGSFSHAEGRDAFAFGPFSHAEGLSTFALGEAAHAEGYITDASNLCSHAEGQQTKALGVASHSEGFGTTATGGASHADGIDAHADHPGSYAWQGANGSRGGAVVEELPYVDAAYHSHGIGTFNINPNGGLRGFYVGDTNMADHISAAVAAASPGAQAMSAVRWQDLLRARAAGTLKPGSQYRITDYETKCNGSAPAATLSGNGNVWLEAGAAAVAADAGLAALPFDVIVAATATNALSEVAQAAPREGHVYASSVNFGAWRLMYCLDNDAARFSWIDGVADAKGVVYRLVDEHGNDCGYDFKNIVFRGHGFTADPADLIHRWSFNDSLEDTGSVGGMTAVLGGEGEQKATLLDNGIVHVSATDSNEQKSWVELGANPIPADLGDTPFTIEVWAAMTEARDYASVFALGVRSDTSAKGLMGVFHGYRQVKAETDGQWGPCMNPIGGTVGGVTGDRNIAMAPGPLYAGALSYFAYVVTPDGNGNATIEGYVYDTYNKILVGKSGPYTVTGWTTSQLKQSWFGLGTTPWNNNNPGADYNEVRVWKKALSQDEIEADVMAGPDALPDAGIWYTFTSWTGGSASDGSLGGSVSGNVVGAFENGGVRYLNRVVFSGTAVAGNVLGPNCASVFGSGGTPLYNSFGAGSACVVLGDSCQYNSFGPGTRACSFGPSTLRSRTAAGCSGLKTGRNCRFGFGGGCGDVVLGDNCQAVTLGDGCQRVQMGNYCVNVMIGNGCQDVVFGTAEGSVQSYFRGITFAPMTCKVHLFSSGSRGDDQYVQSVDVSGFSGSSWVRAALPDPLPAGVTAFRPAGSSTVTVEPEQ